jgi:hypothetical protein
VELLNAFFPSCAQEVREITPYEKGKEMLLAPSAAHTKDPALGHSANGHTIA